MNIQVWIFLCIEHGMLMFKYGLEAVIPDSPTDVGIQLARNDFLVSKASKTISHRLVVVSHPQDKQVPCSIWSHIISSDYIMSRHST